MRYKKIASMVKLLFIFFKRSVLNFGILKSKMFRIIALVGLAIISSLISIFVYKFLNNANMNVELTNSIMDIYSLTTMMWTFVIFLFMKLLFMKKDSFIKFSTQMPISNAEKNVALIVFEIVIALVVVNIIALSIVIAFVAKAGIGILPRVLCNVFFTCSNVYLILELFNRLIAFVVSIYDLNKLKDTIIICSFMILFMIMYTVVMPKFSDGILFNYLDNKGTSIVALFSYIMDNTHFIVSAYLFLALVLCLIAVICLIPDEDIERIKQFVLIKHNVENMSFLKKRLEKNTLYKAYFLNISRRIDSLNLGILVVVAYIMALVMKISSAENIVSLYAINGLYMCVQTQNIRNSLYQKDYDIVKDYMYMIFSQMMYIFILSIPYSILALIRETNVVGLFSMYGMIFVMVVFSTFIGIVFVPKRENPISLMIGMFTTIIFLLIIGLGIYILQVGTVGRMLIISVVTAVIIYYSLIGLVSLKKELCYEN